VRDAPLVAILVGAAAMRLMHLDYSHFQGDEIKALYPPGAPFPEYLFWQKKGPVQFLVTLAVGTLTGGYVEWQTRLPFSLASLLAVYVVFRFVRDEFGRRPALFAAALVGSCGLIVAFGRIVQYQAFCMLFVLLTAYFVSTALRRSEPRLLHAGLVSYAMALLTHYDALTFAPALAWLLIRGARRRDHRPQRYLLHLGLASTAALCLLGLFYLPYMRQPAFPLVADYLLSRVASGQGMGTFAATSELLSLYLPPLSLIATIPFLVIGAIKAVRDGPAASGGAIVTWFATAFAFYMLLGGDPRSHVYNYILPGLILVALGIDAAIGAAERRAAGRAASVAAWGAILLFAALTYYMVVDHTIEHPWDRKMVLGYELPNLVSRRVEGVFGFPYRRGLDQVGALFRSGRLQGTFESNERDVMADYYFQASRSPRPDYYLFVLRPLSLERELPGVVARAYRKVGTITERGRPAIEIYEAPWRTAGR
jgi:drug/metabolite transporter superfamily protein YnfA